MRKKMLPLEFRIYPESRDMSRQWFVKGISEIGKPVKFRVPNAPTEKQRLALAKAVIERYLTEGATSFKKKQKPIQAAHYILQVFTDILEEKKASLRLKSYRSYLSHLRNFNDFVAKEKVKHIDDDAARSFLMFLKNKGLSNTTINAHRVTLTHFYSELIKRKKGKLNPFKATIKLKENRVGAHFLTLTQIAKYKKYVLEHKENLWLPSLMQFYCFLRPSSELRFIRVEDVNLDRRTIRVDSKIAKNGKTEFVKIPDALFPHLEDLGLSDYPDKYFLLGLDSTPSIKPVSQNYWNSNFVKVREAIGLSDKYVFYSFKHSGAADYMNNTGDLMGLSRQMRHYSPDVTSVYLKSIGIEDLEKLRGGFTSL
jgi:integrase